MLSDDINFLHTQLVYSSLGRIKSSEEYARDREFTLNSLLQVSVPNIHGSTVV